MNVCACHFQEYQTPNTYGSRQKKINSASPTSDFFPFSFHQCSHFPFNCHCTTHIFQTKKHKEVRTIFSSSNFCFWFIFSLFSLTRSSVRSFAHSVLTPTRYLFMLVYISGQCLDKIRVHSFVFIQSINTTTSTIKPAKRKTLLSFGFSFCAEQAQRVQLTHQITYIRFTWVGRIVGRSFYAFLLSSLLLSLDLLAQISI